jgi:hypothetical protein
MLERLRKAAGTPERFGFTTVTGFGGIEGSIVSFNRDNTVTLSEDRILSIAHIVMMYPAKRKA